MSNKNTITIQFDDPKDADEILIALQKYTELTWFNDTKRAMIKVFKKDRSVIVSKSITKAPEPFRL